MATLQAIIIIFEWLKQVNMDREKKVARMSRFEMVAQC